MWCILPGLALTPTDFQPLKQCLAASLSVGDAGSLDEQATESSFKQTAASSYERSACKTYEHSTNTPTQHKPESFSKDPSTMMTKHSSSLLRGSADIRILDSWEVPVTGPIQAIRADMLTGGDINRPVNLIGHSVGGLAALEWAIRFPNQVQRLVLLDPTVPEPSPAFWRWAVKACNSDVLPRSWKELLTRRSAALAAHFSPYARTLVFRRAHVPDQLCPDQTRARYGSAEAVSKMAEQFFQSWHQQDRVAKLFDTHNGRQDAALAEASKIKILQVVGVGPHDHAFVNQQRRLAESLGSELHLLFHSNHLFPLSKPQLVTQLVSRWLRH